MNNNWIDITPASPYADDKPPIGFVYRITNTLTGKMYIGRKRITKIVMKRVSGKRKRISVENDWRSYYGSNKMLLEDIAQYGDHKFSREIIRWCYSKGELNYHEAKIQFELDVLLHPDKFYNSWIMVRVNRKHLMLTNQP